MINGDYVVIKEGNARLSLTKEEVEEEEVVEDEVEDYVQEEEEEVI